jgi:hypothetical protein
VTWRWKFPTNSLALVWKIKQFGNVWHDPSVWIPCKQIQTESASPASRQNLPTWINFSTIIKPIHDRSLCLYNMTWWRFFQIEATPLASVIIISGGRKIQLNFSTPWFMRGYVCAYACKSMFSCRKTKGSNMGMPKPFLLLLLLIVTVSASQKQRTIEARALSSLPQQSKYVHIYRNFTLKMSLKRWL